MQPLAFAVIFAVGEALQGAPPTQDTIAPVDVTARKLPDLGDPWEMHLRRVQEQELAKRPHQRQELARNRTLWAASQIDSYRYTVSSRGGWGIDTGTIQVTVRESAVSSVEYTRRPHGRVRDDLISKSPKYDNSTETPYNTVPTMFEIIERALDDPLILMTVSYDSRYGFPTYIGTDLVGASDASGGTHIQAFEVLQ